MQQHAPPKSSGVVMDPLDPRECSGGHTEDRLLLAATSVGPVAFEEEREHVHQYNKMVR